MSPELEAEAAWGARFVPREVGSSIELRDTMRKSLRTALRQSSAPGSLRDLDIICVQPSSNNSKT